MVLRHPLYAAAIVCQTDSTFQCFDTSEELRNEQ